MTRQSVCISFLGSDYFDIAKPYRWMIRACPPLMKLEKHRKIQIHLRKFLSDVETPRCRGGVRVASACVEKTFFRGLPWRVDSKALNTSKLFFYMDRIRTAPNTNSNMHEISLTLSLLNVRVEYKLLVLCVTLNSACDDIFFWKGSEAENTSTLLSTWIAALVTFSIKI